MKFQLRGDFKEDKEHYDDYIAPLFNKEVMLPLFNRSVGFVYNIKKNFYGISVESVKIEKFLNYLGIPSGAKSELFIPNWIKVNSEYAKRFLRGFFDTDGSIFCQKNYSIKNNSKHTQVRISLVSTSLNLMNEIYTLINLLGIKSLLRLRKAKPYKDRYVRKDSYVVSICGGIQVTKWFEYIGSKNPKHITKYQVWKKFGFCPPFTNLETRKKMLKNELSPYLYLSGV